MLVAIISDIHDNLANLDKCLIWCKAQKIKKIVCCGDVCNLETLKFLSTNFSGEIFLVSGNGDIFTESDLCDLKNINYFQEIGIVKIAGLILGLCHQDREIEATIKKSGKKPDFIFYGHSHKPWLEKKDGIFTVNPGNLAGTFYQATFATLNTTDKNLKLKIINDLI
ncbi:MAG: YfcE family phosphodiesterase [Patescibacteria group bacterium]|jgi:hypothetical protein